MVILVTFIFVEGYNFCIPHVPVVWQPHSSIYKGVHVEALGGFPCSSWWDWRGSHHCQGPLQTFPGCQAHPELVQFVTHPSLAESVALRLGCMTVSCMSGYIHACWHKCLATNIHNFIISGFPCIWNICIYILVYTKERLIGHGDLRAQQGIFGETCSHILEIQKYWDHECLL